MAINPPAGPANFPVNLPNAALPNLPAPAPNQANQADQAAQDALANQNQPNQNQNQPFPAANLPNAALPAGVGQNLNLNG